MMCKIYGLEDLLIEETIVIIKLFTQKILNKEGQKQ